MEKKKVRTQGGRVGSGSKKWGAGGKQVNQILFSNCYQLYDTDLKCRESQSEPFFRSLFR